MEAICYSEREVAALLGVSESKLRTDRMKLQGIPFVKIGGSVRYRRQDIDSYLEKNLVKAGDK